MGLFFQCLMNLVLAALWLAVCASARACAAFVICVSLCRLWTKKLLSFSAPLVKSIAEKQKAPEACRGFRLW